MEELRLSGEDSSESLEEFQMVLRELDADKSMDKIRVEYEKLILPLKKSRENEKRLMSKCRELKAEIVSSSTKVAAALKLSEGDEATITSLKSELDKAWQMVDAAHDKERKDSEIIRNIKEDVSNLTQKSGQRDLLKKIEELTEERDQLMKTSEDLKEKRNKSSAALQLIETKSDTAVHKISQLQQDLLVQQNEIFRETRLKETLDKEVKQLHAGVEAKIKEVKALNLKGQQSREEQQKLEMKLKDLRVLHERSTKVLEQIQLKKNGLQQQYEQLSSDKEHFLLQNQQMANQLKINEEEVSHMLQDVTKQTKMREAIQEKLHLIEDQKADVEVQSETLKAHIVALEKELESSQKQVEADKKAQEELIRERDVLNKNMIKAVQSAENRGKLLEQDKKTLEHEISSYRQEGQKQREIIQQLEKERDRHINETSGLMQKVQQKMNDAEAKEIELFSRKKEVTEAEYKLKQQEILLESVISERNLRSKNLLQATEEIVDMKTRKKSMNNEVTLLKDEIVRKKPALARGQQEHKSLEKYNKALKGELQSRKLQLEEAKQHVDSQRAEQQKLQKVISDTEAEQDQHKKQLEQVMRERNNLSRQLLHRNDERALLYEKIRIHQSILNKGDFHYKQKLEDIHLLKLEVTRLQCKKKILDKSLPNIEELRQELFQLRERSRNSVPEETINIHRWRQLEGTNPSKYDLIQKIHVLQRRLISKTKELEKQELSLQEKDKLYMELKQTLARRPGPEAAKQLQKCQWTLRDRSKKLKALTAELRRLESQMDQYKSENERLDNDLADIKKKYLWNKKLVSEQRTRTKVEKIGTLPPLASRPQLTGGGFRIHWPVGQ
ncbi:cilia- and flagella-associated protein 58-like [Cololabis saira]|uniref:cilia- and flagella-associated protein 58-like n=1 Tax=Cololabis saira TaxID=129043 RepID=UPI002AD27F22|nr:cilia- and flagella-associated protein 58-like [Cololabis saira]